MGKHYEEEERKGDQHDSMDENEHRRKNESRSPSYHSGNRIGRRVHRSPGSHSGGSRSPRPGRGRSDSRDRRMSPGDKQEDSFTQIYVAGISRTTTADELEKLFEPCGQIRDIIMKNKYAFIDFKDHRDAVDAIKRLNGKSHYGDTLIVEQSRKYSSYFQKKKLLSTHSKKLVRLT